MRRAVLVALAVCAARADHYAGDAGPQYGGAAVDYERALTGDYRARPPDAPAHLDYNYDEQISETEKPKYAKEERWQSDRTRRRRPARGDLEDHSERRGHDPDSDAGPQSKTSRRRVKHSPRDRRGEPRRRYGVDVAATLGRSRRAKHDDDNTHYLDTNYHEDKSKYLEDNDFITRRETTARGIRRKPRDRMFPLMPSPIPKPSHDEREFEFDEKSDRPVKRDDESGKTEYWTGEENEWPAEWARRLRPGLDARVEPYSDTAPMENDTRNPDAYQDYTDYYNFKKLENLKTKIPTLLRRTTTTTAVRPTTGPRRDGGAAASSTSVATSGPTGAARLREAIRNRMKVKSKSSSAPSRGSKKPPVLLLVTRRTPTVVMVEPAGSGDRRARGAAEDSPATLRRVKRLIRSKLVARAASLRDLTDNWNDTVCEYVDVAVLRGSAAARAPAAALLRAALSHLLVWKFLCDNS